MSGIAALAVAGIVVSAIALYYHYGTSGSSFCDWGESWNCDLVNRSRYSTLGGIPVALIGVFGYLVILALATVYGEQRETPMVLLLTSTAGLAFSLRLAYIEKYVLEAWCILCLTSLAVIVSVVLLTALVALGSGRKT
jgi:vitamin-K-epoxide reductase (warfarin-sensitive)